MAKACLKVNELVGRAVDVWTVRLASSDLAAAHFEAALAPEELTRADRFRFPHLRRSFIVSRGSLRVLIAGYLGITPREVQFSYGARGKPAYIDPATIQFNLSHSGGLALFAFTAGCELGVDIEQIRPLEDMSDIASRFFCSEETAELDSLPAGQRQHAFFLCWTRKEAYIKAVGEGLAVPLDSFRVATRPGEPARLIHLAQDANAAKAWNMHNLISDPEYAAALAYLDAERPIRMYPPVTPEELIELNGAR
jgi:4'-phosphopantetheinyl transferase